ncbi:hypothetical protein [Stenotrophomonas rhizophila]|uniref:hypothetical protein n=1 Tax=Stenotrophomonas rhizophila TaxID=216778 RepID=UPI001E43132B|nr:hypothetical protein [Stenotrophomonas rhizophila]MCC7633899.1 hypothetical protein [Stenotrophomonas rhizophila]MCC7663233.1 hypothetical protein [Stenotrophomonas rhizophila]
MAIALIALLLLEMMVQFAWTPAYYGWGIALFKQRIATPAAARVRLSPGSLERDMAVDTRLPLVFHAMPDGRIAFRESFAVRFYPVMRGRIEVDARRREVRVLGLCNWNTLAITLTMPFMIALRPSAAPMLLMLVMFLVCFLVQRKRFLGVVEAVRAQLGDDSAGLATLEERVRLQRAR